VAPEEVVRALWARIDARDWPGLRALLSDDVVLEYPVSTEKIVGGDNVVAINAEYPDGWSIRLLKVVASGEEVVTEVEVPLENVGVFRVVSFWTVHEQKIFHAREYWTSLGGDEAPEWRRKYGSPL
jgi:ketosteroid isomerase-like protein